MGNPMNLGSNGNQNNSTPDDRVIWEDGTWAIIECGDAWDGLSRSKTRDNLGDAIQATWDPGMTTMPGANSITAKKMVKVKLADLLANAGKAAPTSLGGVLPKAKAFRTPTPADVPAAPPSPYLSKPWEGKNVPEFPHVCRACGGRYYQGLSKTVHQDTENTALDGKCPGAQKSTKILTAKSKWP